MINPELERWYALRAKSKQVEVPGASHAVYVSRPQEVAAIIEEAASSLGKEIFVRQLERVPHPRREHLFTTERPDSRATPVRKLYSSR